MDFDIPKPLFYGFLAFVGLIIVLKLFGTKRKPKPKEIDVEKKEDIMGIMGTPAEIQFGKEPETKSLEEILTKEPEAAPSLGPEEKTDISDITKLLSGEKKEEEVLEIAKGEEMIKPEGKKPVKKPVKKKHHYVNLDEFADLLEEKKEVPRYKPLDEEKKPIKTKGIKKIGILDRLFGKKKAVKGLKYLCMQFYDQGKLPMDIVHELMNKGLTRKEAKELANKEYRIWVEKREPLLRERKEIKEMIKRIEYKFYKREIDEKTMKEMINEKQKKLIEIEAKIKSSEDYFFD